MENSLSSELYGIPEAHSLLEIKMPQYSVTTLNRAYLVWNKMGCKTPLPNVCNYYHQLERLEKLLSDEQRRKSINLEVILKKHDPPKSKFFLRLFPNVYPKPEDYVNESDELVSNVTNVSEPPSNPQTTDSAAPVDIYFITNLIREFCDKHNKTQKQFLNEFKAYAHQCQINLTVSNVAFYIKYQNVLLGKDVVKSELKAYNRVEDIEVTAENRHIIQHIEGVLEPAAVLVESADEKVVTNVKSQEKLNGVKTDDDSESFNTAMYNLKLDCSDSTLKSGNAVDMKISNGVTQTNSYMSNNNILIENKNIELIPENKQVLKERNNDCEVKIKKTDAPLLMSSNNNTVGDAKEFPGTLNYASAVMKESLSKKNKLGIDKLKPNSELKVIKNHIDKAEQNSLQIKDQKRNKNASRKENIKENKAFANFDNTSMNEQKKTNSNLNRSLNDENKSLEQSFVILNNSFSGMDLEILNNTSENDTENMKVQNGHRLESNDELKSKSPEFATSFNELVNVNQNLIKNTKVKKQKKKKSSKKIKLSENVIEKQGTNNEDRKLRDITNKMEEVITEQQEDKNEGDLKNLSSLRESRKQEAVALAESVKKMAINMQRIKLHFIENKSLVDTDKLMREIFETETKKRGKKKKNMANEIADMLDNELEGLFNQISGLVDDSDASSTYDADQIEKNLNLTSEIRRKVTKLFDKVNKNLEKLNINLTFEELTNPEIKPVQKKVLLEVQNVGNKAGPSNLANISCGSDSLAMLSCMDNDLSEDDASNISADFQSLEERRFSTSSQ